MTKIILAFFLITVLCLAEAESHKFEFDPVQPRKDHMNFMEIENKIAWGFKGEYEYRNEENQSSPNFSMSSETLYRVDKKVKVGLGAAAKFRGRMKTETGKVFVYDSLPVYLSYRVFPLKTKKYRPFVKLSYGISFNHGDESSKGVYYSGGLGIEVLDTWIYDLIYEEAEGEYLGEDCVQKMISLGAGYKVKF